VLRCGNDQHPSATTTPLITHQHSTGFRESLVQIQTRLQRLQQQGAKLCVPDIISKFKRQQDQLQAKLQLLTATLTDSKQANACMRSRVESANADNKTQLLAATVSHCAKASHACATCLCLR